MRVLLPLLLCGLHLAWGFRRIQPRLKPSTFQAKTSLETDTIDTNFSKDIRNTLGWVAAAGIFGAGVGVYKGTDAAIEFVSGYALEQSLSVDNLFVFLVLFDYFKVDREKQSKVLTYGILGAIILRAIFIGFGGIAIQNFHQVLAIFAAVLLYSSCKMLFMEDNDDDEVDWTYGSCLLVSTQVGSFRESDRQVH